MTSIIESKLGPSTSSCRLTIYKLHDDRDEILIDGKYWSL